MIAAPPVGRFPDGFLWGAATAAHQVEGGNSGSDVWALEHARPSLFREPSGDATDHYHRFADDMAILAGIGLTAYRFSIEWARIEPEPGCFSRPALDHYQRCVDACLSRGIAPILTFHHFTLPLWQARQGGLTDPSFPDRFALYCERAAGALSGFDIACTLNELNLPLLIRGPVLERQQNESGRARLAAAERILGGSLDHTFLFTPSQAVLGHGLSAHAKAREAIKSSRPHVSVGLTLAIQDEQAQPGAEDLRDRRRADFYDAFLEAAAGDDFIGVQTYSRVVSRRDGGAGPEPGHPLTQMGYEDRPQALAETCRHVWERTGAPILVTENGWAGEDDGRRAAFVREALGELLAAISEGVDVRGYLYWSLLDNYEWMAGYRPRFGLIAVDRATQARRIKPSALALGEIAQANGWAEDGRAEPQVVAVASGTPVGA
jgi:beta-glucosidase